MHIWLPLLAWCCAAIHTPKAASADGTDTVSHVGGEGLEASAATPRLRASLAARIADGADVKPQKHRRKPRYHDHPQKSRTPDTDVVVANATEMSLSAVGNLTGMLGDSHSPDDLNRLRAQALNGTVYGGNVGVNTTNSTIVSEQEQEELREQALEMDVVNAEKIAEAEFQFLVKGESEVTAVINRTFQLKNSLYRFEKESLAAKTVNMTMLECLMLEMLIQSHRGWFDMTMLLSSNQFLTNLDTLTKKNIGMKVNKTFHEVDEQKKEYEDFLAWGQGLLLNIANSTPYEANKRLTKLSDAADSRKKKSKEVMDSYEAGHYMVKTAVKYAFNETAQGKLSELQEERLNTSFNKIDEKVNSIVFWADRQVDEVFSCFTGVVKTIHSILISQYNFKVPREAEKTGMAPVMAGFGLLQMNSAKKPTKINFHQGPTGAPENHQLSQWGINISNSSILEHKNIGDYVVQLFTMANDVQNETQAWGQGLGNRLRDQALAMDVWAAEMLAYELHNNLAPVEGAMTRSLNRTFEHKNDLLKFTAESMKERHVNVTNLENIVCNVLSQHQQGWINSTALLGNTVNEFINNLELAGQGRLAEEANAAAVATASLVSPYNLTLTRVKDHLSNITIRPPDEASQQLFKVTNELQASVKQEKANLQHVCAAFSNLANNFNSTFNQTVDGMLSNADGVRLNEAFKTVHTRVSWIMFHAGRANEELATCIDRVVKDLTTLLPHPREQVHLPAFG